MRRPDAAANSRLESVHVCVRKKHGVWGGGVYETKHAHMIAFYVILHSQTSSGGAQGGSEGKILSSVREEV